MSDVTNPSYLPVATVAELLSVSPAHVYSLIATGELPAFRVGRRGPWRIAANVVETFIRTCHDLEVRRLAWNEMDNASVIDLADGRRW